MTTHQPTEGPEPPELADRYELSELLGSGGMAKVYLARDVELDRRVAVKLVPRTTDHEEGYVERLRREARAAASLSHPAAVSVYDIGTSGPNVFVVMEYLDGETLREVLNRKGALSVDTAARIAGEVCAALSAAHTQGVIHRDISPGNVMVCAEGAVKVLDFGIALISKAGFATETGTVLGTPAYLSPEQARGRTLDARSDLYSLGCCLYEMVTGCPPFAASTPAAFAYQHVNDEPRPPRSLDPAIPAWMQRVILRAMSKDPADRYPSAAAMADALTGTGTATETDAGARTTVRYELPAALADATDTATVRARRTEVPAADADGVSDDVRGTRRQRLGLALIIISLTTLVVVGLLVVFQRLSG